MTKQATPRPWKYKLSPAEHGTPAQAWIMGGDGLCVVMKQNCGGDQDAKANARLIVNAVNCHDELVEALKKAQVRLLELENSNLATKADQLARECIEQALARAEGEGERQRGTK